MEQIISHRTFAKLAEKNSSDILMTALTYCNPNDMKCLNAYTTELIRNKK